MDDLLQKKCVPCEGNVPRLTKQEAEQYLAHVPGWTLDEEVKHVSKKYIFSDFMSALDFAREVGVVAEAENHHPDLTISWGKVGVSITTHAIKGLSENDFILAAKIDALTKK